MDSSLEYIQHNRVRLKEGSQKKVTEIFKEFFELEKLFSEFSRN